MKYLIEFGSLNGDHQGTFISTSRDSKKHGREYIGCDEYATDGYVVAYAGRNEGVEDILKSSAFPPHCVDEAKKLKMVSMARYTPENGGRWYNCCVSGLSYIDEVTELDLIR